MLQATGPVLLPAELAPERLLHSLAADRRPLVLAASSDRGWFGGVRLVAFDPVAHSEADPVTGAAVAGAAIDSAMVSDTPLLSVAVLDYEGQSTVATYAGGLLATAEGWRAWGELDPSAIPKPTEPAPVPLPDASLVLDPEGDLDRDAFVAAVEATREAIARGDVYVLNLTYRLAGEAVFGIAETFSTLIARGAGAMSAALVTPERALLSISPERFVALDGREARIEPIKGTRPRGDDPTADRAWAADLAGSEKERAEHVMIVDLERNDLGRVCVPGTISVDPLYEVVPTPYCHQLVSTVRGTLRGDARAVDVISATFPCGSVTGAPKISAMRHIAGLERSARGAYCGALLVAVPGRLDSSVLIRTASVRGRMLEYGTGGGITYDSDPEAEWEETLLKARPLLGCSAG